MSRRYRTAIMTGMSVLGLVILCTLLSAAQLLRQGCREVDRYRDKRMLFAWVVCQGDLDAEPASRFVEHLLRDRDLAKVAVALKISNFDPVPLLTPREFDNREMQRWRGTAGRAAELSGLHVRFLLSDGMGTQFVDHRAGITTRRTVSDFGEGARLRPVIPAWGSLFSFHIANRTEGKEHVRIFLDLGEQSGDLVDAGKKVQRDFLGGGNYVLVLRKDPCFIDDHEFPYFFATIASVSKCIADSGAYGERLDRRGRLFLRIQRGRVESP